MLLTVTGLSVSVGLKTGLSKGLAAGDGLRSKLLDSIDLKLDSRRLTMIMGTNGAGKSLLLRVLHGLLQADEGEILWNGRSADEALRQRQAMVFQKPVVLRRSVASNLDFVLKTNRKVSAKYADAQRVQRRNYLLEEVGLLAMADRPARLLSGGEQQRLALARALAAEPEVLFLDEPTASLDPASAIIIEQLVKKVSDSGSKVIFVSHDLAQARRLADDIVFLHAGKICEHCSVQAFFANPVSAAANAYINGKLYL